MSEEKAIRRELLELQELLNSWESEPEEWSPDWMSRQSLLSRQADLIHRQSLLGEDYDVVVFLHGDTVHGNVVEAGFLGGFLDRLQTTLSAITHGLMGERGSRGSFADHVLHAATLDLVATGAGWFKLALEPHQTWQQTDLTGDPQDPVLTPIDEALEKLLDVIDAGQMARVEPGAALLRAIAGLSAQRAAARVVDLSRFVGISGTSARIVHRRRFDRSSPRDVSLSCPVAQRLGSILTTAETRDRRVEVNGMLTGVRWSARSFDLETDRGEIVSGHVPLVLRGKGRELFDRFVDAVLIETTVVTVDGDKSSSYSLVDLSPVDQSGIELPGLDV